MGRRGNPGIGPMIGSEGRGGGAWRRLHVVEIVVAWPSGLRRRFKAPVRKGVGSNPTAARTLLLYYRHAIATEVAACAYTADRTPPPLPPPPPPPPPPPITIQSSLSNFLQVIPSKSRSGWVGFCTCACGIAGVEGARRLGCRR